MKAAGSLRRAQMMNSSDHTFSESSGRHFSVADAPILVTVLKRELREPTFEEWPIGEALTACLSLTRDQVAPPRERRSLDELSALGIEPSPDDLQPRLLMKGVDGREALVRHGAVSALIHCLERLGFRLGELLEMQLLCMKVLAALASCDMCSRALVDDHAVSRAATDRIRPFIAHGDLTEMILAILATTTRDAKVQAILLAELEQATFSAAVHSGVAALVARQVQEQLAKAARVRATAPSTLSTRPSSGSTSPAASVARQPHRGVASREGGKRPGAGDLAAILAGNLDGAKEPAAAAALRRSAARARGGAARGAAPSASTRRRSRTSSPGSTSTAAARSTRPSSSAARAAGCPTTTTS